MVMAENVSPTGKSITIKFMVTVIAAIRSRDLWQEFPEP
jgi:hypothetical protein